MFYQSFSRYSPKQSQVLGDLLIEMKPFISIVVFIAALAVIRPIGAAAGITSEKMKSAEQINENSPVGFRYSSEENGEDLSAAIETFIDINEDQMLQPVSSTSQKLQTEV